ncbi:MAG: flagellar biosynthesis protein FlhA [Granulosicoccaceae bacterium]
MFSVLDRAVRDIRLTGLGAPLLVLLMLSMMVLPIPTVGLDFLFTFNIALSLIVLLVSVYTNRPLEFSAFPTVLLITTMLRLSLNIASTRVVLIEGHTGTASAGQVIESFGDFVIGGNYAVGLVVFAILVIINFVVVTKGAGRVSEVSARFVLDAMPGKQMAIDADLNAGILDQEQAKQRREEISQEADFYGSMDGASKFVKGDAIAGLMILIINIVGGLAVGMGQHDLSFSEASRNYTLLTIGDGLVAQIPSLLLSMATAIIVTRVSASQDMGEQISMQLFKDPKALTITAILISALGIVPGMPNMVFLVLGGCLGAFSWHLHKREERSEEESPVNTETDTKDTELSWDDVKPTDMLELEVGFGLIPLVDPAQNGTLPDRIKALRRKLTEQLGFLIHSVHIRDNLDLAPNRYRIRLFGVTEGEGDIYPDKELAIGTAPPSEHLVGIAAKDPAYGMDAIWIDVTQRANAEALGYTVVDPGTVIATHLSKLLMQQAGSMLGHQEVQQLLDALAQVAPRLLEDLVPKTIALPVVVKVLQNLLDEGIPIRDMRTIMETLSEKGVTTQEPEELTAFVRVSLRRLITGQLTNYEDSLPVITLDAELEKLCLQSVENEATGGLGLEPSLTERLYQSLADSVQSQEVNGEAAVLLVNPKLRPWLAGLVRHSIPLLKVLAYNEISETKRLKVVANIGG